MINQVSTLMINAHLIMPKLGYLKPGEKSDLEQISYNTVVDFRHHFALYRANNGEIKITCPAMAVPNRKNKRRVRYFRIFGGKKNK